jgi:hypothetical protein
MRMTASSIIVPKFFINEEQVINQINNLAKNLIIGEMISRKPPMYWALDFLCLPIFKTLNI